MVVLSTSGSFTSISSDRNFFYICGSNSMEIIDKKSQISRGFVSRLGGFSCIWAEDISFIYLGTEDNGLYLVEKVEDISVSENITPKLFRDSISNDLQSQSIKCINGLDSSYYAIGTSSGIEVFTELGHFYSSSLSPVTTLKVTPDKDIFYGGPFGLAVKKEPTSNWTSPEDLLVTPFLPDNNVKDIDVSITEEAETSVAVSTGNGVLFFIKREPVKFSSRIKMFVI